jgi:hypothetical protein
MGNDKPERDPGHTTTIRLTPDNDSPVVMGGGAMCQDNAGEVDTRVENLVKANAVAMTATATRHMTTRLGHTPA